MRIKTAVAVLMVSALIPMAQAQTSTSTQAILAAQQSNQLVDLYLNYALSYVVSGPEASGQAFTEFLTYASDAETRTETILMSAESGNQYITTARLYEQLAKLYTQTAANPGFTTPVAITFIQVARRYQQWSEFFLYLALTTGGGK